MRIFRDAIERAATGCMSHIDKSVAHQTLTMTGARIHTTVKSWAVIVRSTRRWYEKNSVCLGANGERATIIVFNSNLRLDCVSTGLPKRIRCVERGIARKRVLCLAFETAYAHFTLPNRIRIFRLLFSGDFLHIYPDIKKPLWRYKLPKHFVYVQMKWEKHFRMVWCFFCFQMVQGLSHEQRLCVSNDT